jgi:hypothetical protein
MTKTHNNKMNERFKIEDISVRMNCTRREEFQWWLGGPQQMSMSVSRWKKWLSSNCCDAGIFGTIAMTGV